MRPTEHIDSGMVFSFTGSKITAFGKPVRATCVVRNDVNGRRTGPDDVLRELNGRIVHEGGTPYQPRPFPPGLWEITEVVWTEPNSVYWPVILKTNAHQSLAYWDLNKDGKYKEPTGETFDGWGYWIHHARYWKDGELTDSSTTYGCINVIEVEDMARLGEDTEQYIAGGKHRRVFVNVPKWDEWT